MVLRPEPEDVDEAELNAAVIAAVVVEEVMILVLLVSETNLLEGRGGRGRGRGEPRGRGRGGAAGVASDAISTAATIASDESPNAWGPDVASVDDTTLGDPEAQDFKSINGTKTHEETPAASTSVWGAPPVEEALPTPPTNANGTLPQRPTISSNPSRQSRIVDPTAKFSWASIVKPAAPPPAPKPAPPPQSAPQPPPAPTQQVPPAPPTNSRPSTRGQEFSEEPAQTIHDPFATAEPSKPKVQLPQPALPYIPSMIQQPKESLPPTEPLTSRNLDLLEDQQTPVSEPPTPSVTAHRASPAPKNDGPPGLTSRFSRPTRENPVIMPTMASQSLGGMPLQFG